MRNPKSTPLQRLNDAAEKIRAEIQAALDSDAPGAAVKIEEAIHKAHVLGLEIWTDEDGTVTVSRPHREEEK